MIVDRLKSPLRRRGRPEAAARALPGDDPQAGQGPRAPQEADRRPRPVRRLPHRDRAAAERRRGLRVRQRDQGRRDPRRASSRRSRRASRGDGSTAPVAGYPVKGVRVRLFDGSYHTVDSSEMAFKIAGSHGDERGARAGRRRSLLEPIMLVTLSRPRGRPSATSSATSTRRRGRPQGMEPARRHDRGQGRGADGRDADLRARPALADRRPGRLHDGVRCATRRSRRTSRRRWSPRRARRRGRRRPDAARRIRAPSLASTRRDAQVDPDERPVVACDVCGRTLLRGRARRRLPHAGGRGAMVCELCTRARRTRAGSARASTTRTGRSRGGRTAAPARCSPPGRARAPSAGASAQRRRAGRRGDAAEPEPDAAAPRRAAPGAAAARREREPRSRAAAGREPRHVHAVPTNAELKMAARARALQRLRAPADDRRRGAARSAPRRDRAPVADRGQRRRRSSSPGSCPGTASRSTSADEAAGVRAWPGRAPSSTSSTRTARRTPPPTSAALPDAGRRPLPDVVGSRVSRAMIYCVVPEELAPELYDKLVEYYADDPNVTVIVDRRKAEPPQRVAPRRRPTQRRSPRPPPAPACPASSRRSGAD